MNHHKLGLRFQNSRRKDISEMNENIKLSDKTSRVFYEIKANQREFQLRL